MLIADVLFPNMSCDMIQYDINDTITPGLIDVFVFHEQGMLPAICNSIDTISLGVLEAGSYRLDYYVGYATAPATPSDDIYFDVLLVTSSQKQPQKQEAVQIYPNPAQKAFYIKRAQTNNKARFILYNCQGVKIKAFYSDASSVKIKRRKLPAGMYFVEVIENKQVTGRYKVVFQ